MTLHSLQHHAAALRAEIRVWQRILRRRTRALMAARRTWRQRPRWKGAE